VSGGARLAEGPGAAVAVIPARGGSKRIPRKNVRPFCGRPMIAHPIRAALESGCFARVIVSTDDAEIAEVARAHGAETPFVRPAELSDDQTGTNEVVAHALRWLGARGAAPETAACLYATAPFLEPEDIRRGQALLAEPGRRFAVTVTTFAFPIQRAVRRTPEGGLAPFDAQAIRQRSQDLEEAWHDAGALYWGRSDAFLSGEPLFAPHTAPIPLPRHRVQDIDTLEDWQRAELMYRCLQEMRAAEAPA
jgi:N-acylneuraminate cytidylyltransferase